MSRVSLFVVLVVIGFLSGCGTRAEAPMVFPSAVGLDLTIQEILADTESYESYYCNTAANPSALMFVPKTGRFKVVPERRGLGLGWQAENDPKALRRMQQTILDRDMVQNPVLRVLMTPRMDDGQRHPLAFVYSIKDTFARAISDESEAFLVLSIPEIPGKYGNDNLAPWHIL
ncbi:MAG: hypothetical protein EOM25_00620 [Deltaproteobacteria bacterium]|nr:hypothetical protein [Deltaproteobacteria bacterium]